FNLLISSFLREAHHAKAHPEVLGLASFQASVHVLVSTRCALFGDFLCGLSDSRPSVVFVAPRSVTPPVCGPGATFLRASIRMSARLRRLAPNRGRTGRCRVAVPSGALCGHERAQVVEGLLDELVAELAEWNRHKDKNQSREREVRGLVV